MSTVAVYLPDRAGPGGPGLLGKAALDVLEVGPAAVVLPEATISDDRGGELFDGTSLVFDPALGGGPFATAADDRQARAFGVVNTAFHVQQGMRFAARLLGRPLPHLLVRVGMHDQPRRWGGGHYRLPGDSRPAEIGQVSPDGEVHLGGGRKMLRHKQGQHYFHAPAHNAAIVYHELGHHICRHTADFRLNRLRPANAQVSGKTGIDEGTADLIAAIMLQTPDIYGWHRGAVPEWDQRRRKLDGRWTMAQFYGGHEQDQHADGTIWASACWSARQQVADLTGDPARFDVMLLRGLDLFGRDGEQQQALRDAEDGTRSADALRPRRHFAALLAAIVRADPELAPVVLAAMASHGIHLGASNAELRDAARARPAQRVGT